MTGDIVFSFANAAAGVIKVGIRIMFFFTNRRARTRIAMPQYAA
ncbi:MAG: hypothetical protein VB959_24090 [Rhodospirillales bacterium]